MKTLTITRISRSKEPKNGKFGEYYPIGIQAEEYGPDAWINGAQGKQNAEWEEGQVVTVDAVTEKEYNGKMYYYFKMPKLESFGGGGMSAEQFQKIDKLLANQDVIIGKLNDLLAAGQVFNTEPVDDVQKYVPPKNKPLEDSEPIYDSGDVPF